MRSRQSPLAIAAVLVVVVAGCAAHHSTTNRSPTSLEPVVSDPAPVVVPPNGYPGGSLSTDDSNRRRQGYLGYSQVPVRNTPEAQKAEATDVVVYPSAAPVVETKPLPAKVKHVKKMAAVKHKKAKHRATKVVMAKKRHSPRVAAVYVAPQSPYTVRLRQVEALNRLHHVNQSEIALANIALKHSPSSSTLAMAQQTKDEHQRMEKRVEATAQRLGIKLEDYSPATYEVAVNNELLRDTGHFEQYIRTAMNRAHSDAEHDLTVANGETMHDQELAALIRAEKPLLAANRVVPASYRNESVAREGETDLGK